MSLRRWEWNSLALTPNNRIPLALLHWKVCVWSCFFGMEIISPPLYEIGSVIVAVVLKWSGSRSWAKSVAFCCSSSVGSRSSPNASLGVSLRMVCSSCVSVMKLSCVKVWRLC